MSTTCNIRQANADKAELSLGCRYDNAFFDGAERCNTVEKNPGVFIH